MHARILLATALAAICQVPASAEPSYDAAGDLAAEIGEVARAVRASCDGTGGFGGGCADAVAGSGRLDGRWLGGGTRIRNPFGGTVDVVALPDGSGFEVTARGVSPIACAAVASAPEAVGGAVAVRVGGAEEDPADPAATPSACMASGGSAAVTWTFR
jgi:hypothetical protein